SGGVPRMTSGSPLTVRRSAIVSPAPCTAALSRFPSFCIGGTPRRAPAQGQTASRGTMAGRLPCGGQRPPHRRDEALVGAGRIGAPRRVPAVAGEGRSAALFGWLARVTRDDVGMQRRLG